MMVMVMFRRRYTRRDLLEVQEKKLEAGFPPIDPLSVPLPPRAAHHPGEKEPRGGGKKRIDYAPPKLHEVKKTQAGKLRSNREIGSSISERGLASEPPRCLPFFHSRFRK